MKTAYLTVQFTVLIACVWLLIELGRYAWMLRREQKIREHQRETNSLPNTLVWSPVTPDELNVDNGPLRQPK